MSKIRSKLSLLFKILIAVGLIYWMIQKGFLNLEAIRNILEPKYLIPCMFLVFITLYVNNYRWLLLLRVQGFKASVKTTLPLSLIGLFFNYAVPGGVGGDVIKGYYLLQDQKNRKVAAATSILMDRIIGLFVMTTIAGIAVLLNWDLVLSKPELAVISIGIFSVLAVFVLAFCVTFSKWVFDHPLRQKIFKKLPMAEKLEAVYYAVHSYNKDLRTFFYTCLLSFVSQLLTVWIFKIVGDAIGGEPVTWLTYMFVIPVGLIATAVPISPAGIGVGQAVFLILFSWKLGHQTPLGPNIATAYQILSFAWGLPGAYFYFTRRKPNIDENWNQEGLKSATGR